MRRSSRRSRVSGFLALTTQLVAARRYDGAWASNQCHARALA